MANDLIPRESFKSNSHASKKTEKKVEKVIHSEVTTRKKPLGKKFAEVFLGDDIDSVKGYILFDVIVPTIKDTISNVISSGVDMLLFGEKGSSGSKNGSHISYQDYYSNRKGRTTRSNVRAGRHDFRDIIIETRGEAEEVLSNLVDLVYDFGSASVADLYDLVGITGNFTDNKYGWTDLSGASVTRARGGGYLIDLPRTEALD